MSFIKHGDGKITHVIHTAELTEQQKKDIAEKSDLIKENSDKKKLEK